MTERDRTIGTSLLALGVLLLVSNITGAGSGWIWLAAIAAVFLYAHRTRREPGLAVPGGVLAGIALGVLLEGLLPFDGIFLLGLAAGFYLTRTLEPKVHEWAIWPAGILAAIAAATVLSSNTWLLVLALLGSGAYLLGRKRPDRDLIRDDRPAAPQRTNEQDLNVPLEEREVRETRPEER